MTLPGPIPPLILASRSPRRRRILDMLGLDFDVVPADIDERMHPDETPEDAARRLALDKATAVARLRPDALVVGSDTLVTIGGEVLGKPADAEEACAILMRLAGRRHRVETGVALVSPSGEAVCTTVGADVLFRAFDRRDAEEYVATGEPMDKAGAYAIQGIGAALVDAIEGDYYAVMGLPVGRMLDLIEMLGWRFDFRGLGRV